MHLAKVNWRHAKTGLEVYTVVNRAGRKRACESALTGAVESESRMDSTLDSTVHWTRDWTREG